MKAFKILVGFYHNDFPINFCGNFILLREKNLKKLVHKNSLISSFRDFLNLFFTSHVVLRNGDHYSLDGYINLSNHLSGNDEIFNAWESERFELEPLWKTRVSRV